MQFCVFAYINHQIAEGRTKFARNSYKFRTNACGKRLNSEVSVGLVRNSHEFVRICPKYAVVAFGCTDGHCIGGPSSSSVTPNTLPLSLSRTSSPAEHAACERAGGDVAQWLEQQQQHLERWQVRALSAEAALRDTEQHLAPAHEDREAADVEDDSVRCDKEPLTAKAKTLEQEAQRAKGGMAGPTAEVETESLTAERVVGGGGPVAPILANAGFLLAGAGLICAGRGGTGTDVGAAMGLRMALVQGKMEVEVGTVAPMSNSCSTNPPPPPPDGGGVGRHLWGGEQRFQGSASRNSAAGAVWGGGVHLPWTSQPAVPRKLHK